MWTLRDYQPEDFPQMLLMTKEEYGAENDISCEAFIRHEYFENPTGDALIRLAKDTEGGELAGQYVVNPMRFSVFGKECIVSNSLNTLTSVKYRGQNVFTGLAKSIYEQERLLGHAFCYGMPNQNSYHGFIHKLGFQEIARVPLYLRPLSMSSLVAEYTKCAPLGYPAKIIDPLLKIGPALSCGFEFLRITEDRLPLVDALWRSVKGKYPIINVRDSSFIRYRYLDMPNRKYYPYVAVKDNQPVALCIGRIMEVAGLQCAMIVDFIFASPHAAAAKQLLCKVLHDMQQEGASLGGCLMLPHTQEAKLLKSFGFFKCPKVMEPQPFPLIIKLFDSAFPATQIANPENWFFTMADYDVI